MHMYLIYIFIFAIITIYVLIKNIFYALYEFKNQKNKSGGIAVIIFSISVIIFSNIILFFRL